MLPAAVSDPMLVAMLFPLAALAKALWWLLSSPDRRVPRAHYDTSRRFLVTGGASGMGRHVARALLRQGHRVCVCDVADVEEGDLWNDVSIKRSADVTPLLVHKLDVRSAADWDHALASCEDEWGGLDVVMNVAGVLAPNKIQDATLEEIYLQVDVNIKVRKRGSWRLASVAQAFDYSKEGVCVRVCVCFARYSRIFLSRS